MRTRSLLVPFGDWTTWAQVTEPDVPAAGALPVVVLHGGPGAAHDYLRNLAELASAGRVVVHYDQLGCGRSSHLPDAPAEFWTPELFLQEFLNLIAALQLDRYHLIGHSWGGMLGAEIAVRGLPGLASLSLLSTPASAALWGVGTERLRQELPAEMQRALVLHESHGTTDHADYLAVVDHFTRRHVCRMDPYPDDFVATMKQMEADPTVYLTMQGVNEFFISGTLKDWTIADRAAQIQVPTLVLAGEFDEATSECWTPFSDRVPDVRAHLIADASHFAHLERPHEVHELLKTFVAQHDGP